MSKVITDKLVDDILEIVLEGMDCQHEVDHDEDGAHTSVEYGFKNELKVRNKIIAILEPPPKSPTGLSQEELLKELDRAVGLKRVAYEQIKAIIQQGVPILWEHDRFQTLEKGGKLPEKKGLTVDEIIAKYPMSVRILLIQLMEQIKKGEKEGG